MYTGAFRDALRTVGDGDDRKGVGAVPHGDGQVRQGVAQDACWFGRQLYVSALALQPAEREHALRTLAWLETQGSSS
jgi:hypothetical protein